MNLTKWARRARRVPTEINRIVPRPDMIWHCPRCGTQLEHDGLELWCPAEEETIPWAELGGDF